MIKYGIIAGIISTIVSIAALAIFKTHSIAVPIGSGLVAGGTMTWWMARSRKRIPTRNERMVLIGSYGLFMAAVVGLPALGGEPATLPGMMILALYVLSYPAFFSTMFTEKFIAAQIEKHS